MNKRKATTLFLVVEYLVVFVCFLSMFFFITPQSDVFLFARNTDGSLFSALEHSLYYGNGRLLGNLIAVFFSSHFEFAGLLLAISMTVIVGATNHLLFNSNPHFMFLTAIVVAFPSAGILKECYYLFASFVNYMFSLIPILLILILIRSMDKRKDASAILKILTCIFILFLGISSCLFSENTTIVSFVLSICLLISQAFVKKIRTSYSFLYFLSTIVGSITMFMIPKVTETEWKMEHYRKLSTTIPEIIDSAFGSFVKFSQIFTGILPAVIPLSIALFVLAIKNSNKLQKIQQFIFLLYPIYCVVNATITLTSLYIPWTNLFPAMLTALFIVAAAYTIFCIKDKQFRLNALFISAALMSTVAPMMLVNQYGHRTYVITFFVALFLSAYLLKKSSVLNFSVLQKHNISPKLLSSVFCCIFLGLTVFLTSQTIYNYNFYVERTTYIANEINNNQSESIKVPILPSNSTSVEDDYPNIIADIVPVGKASFDITYFTDCENAEQYKAILSDSLPSQVIKAFQNIHFKNPLIIEELTDK